MKKATYIILIFLIVLGCKNNNKIDKNADIISHDSTWARNEFNLDKYEQLQLIRYGPPPKETEEYYWTVLANEYNIGIKFSRGCLIDAGIECYNDLMSKEIRRKYGNNFFEKVNEKVDSIYKIDKPLIEKVRKLGYSATKRSLNNISVFNTPDERIKIVKGYGWIQINKKYRITNLFQISIDRYSKEIVKIDTTKIEESPLIYR